VKLLNVDKPGNDEWATHENITRFEQKWAEDRTYLRWAEGESFYGFNYHSGAMLGPEWSDPPLWKHFGQMYFDQVLILLYLRVALFRFSTELSKISARARNIGYRRGVELLRGEFQNLRLTFALFQNLYQFPLLSNQQQGVEMYTLARQHLDVNDLFCEVQEEIHSSHEFLAVEEAGKLSKVTARLTVVATVGLILGLVFSFLGMNIVNPETYIKAHRELLSSEAWILLGRWVGISAVFLAIVIIVSRQLSWLFNSLAKPGEWLGNWFTVRKHRGR
jgi:hypothetical protein